MVIRSTLASAAVASRTHRRFCRSAILLCGVAVLLGGCAAVDHVSPRAARYNVETSDAKSRSIFTNILRAADGEPLQFTDITTITGTGDVEGSVGAELPYKVKPSTVERTWTVSPSIKASAGSQFNVANLNTQEFYYGLQSPVKVQHIANFIAAGYDPSLVLFLMIDEIEVKGPTRRIVIHSDATSKEAYVSFRQAIQFLLEAGLSTREGAEKFVGPVLTAQQIRDPKILSTLLGASGGKYSLSEVEPKVPGGIITYRLAKDGEWGFCFDPLKVADKTFFDTEGVRTARWTSLGQPAVRLLNNRQLPATFRAPLLASANRKPLEDAYFEISPASFCDPPEGFDTKEKLDKVTLKPRSVEGIFQFLGNIARAQIASPEALAFSREAEGKPPFFPFHVIKGPAPADAAITVVRDGISYSLVADRTGANDQSTRVLQLMTVLLALQSSAKDLPTPSAISVIMR